MNFSSPFFQNFRFDYETERVTSLGKYFNKTFDDVIDNAEWDDNLRQRFQSQVRDGEMEQRCNTDPPVVSTLLVT